MVFHHWIKVSWSILLSRNPLVSDESLSRVSGKGNNEVCDRDIIPTLWKISVALQKWMRNQDRRPYPWQRIFLSFSIRCMSCKSFRLLLQVPRIFYIPQTCYGYLEQVKINIAWVLNKEPIDSNLLIFCLKDMQRVQGWTGSKLFLNRIDNHQGISRNKNTNNNEKSWIEKTKMFTVGHYHGGVPVCMPMITGKFLRNIAFESPWFCANHIGYKAFLPSAQGKAYEINPFKLSTRNFHFNVHTIKRRLKKKQKE